MKEDLIEKDLRYKIIGCAMKVHNEIGHGFREKTYENAMCVEFEEIKLSCSNQKEYPIYYHNKLVDNFIPDLVVEEKIIVELKTVENIIDAHIAQILNYLRVTGIEVGLIINFKHPEIKWKALVLERTR